MFLCHIVYAVHNWTAFRFDIFKQYDQTIVGLPDYFNKNLLRRVSVGKNANTFAGNDWLLQATKPTVFVPLAVELGQDIRTAQNA